VDDPSPVTEPVAISAHRAGAREASADAVIAAYEAHESAIYSFALASTRDPEAAADLVQEAFLRLLDYTRSHDMPDNPGGWLYRVCSNLIISQARRRSVARRFAPALVDRRSPTGPETEVVDRENAAELGEALGGLPPAAVAGLLLAARGSSGREIAEVLGKSEGATRTLMSRARAQLRTTLAQAELHR